MTTPAAGVTRTRGADDLAIVLTGGGARAAYQVGFLRWVARHLPHARFPIVTGVSAGAINATFLAASPGSQADAVEQLCDLWRTLTVDRVFRVDSRSLVSHVARWGLRLLSGGSKLAPEVRGLLDCTPLRDTLRDVYDLRDGDVIGGIAENIDAGRLWALALVTSDYETGRSVIWTQGRELSEWERPDRQSRNTRLTLDHILASSALPLFFPAVRLQDGWYGDGGIRMTAPCSASLHLGANRILAISTRYDKDAEVPTEDAGRPDYPSPLQISGQLLNAIFLDDLDRDALALERVNQLLREIPPEKRRGLRPVDLLVIRPSVDLGRLVADYEPQLPRVFRHLVRGLGSRETKSPDVLSLLAFQPAYINRLIELGEADAEARADEIRALIGDRPSQSDDPASSSVSIH